MIGNILFGGVPTIFGGYFVRNIWDMNGAQVVCYISGAMVPMASWALVLMIWGGEQLVETLVTQREGKD